MCTGAGTDRFGPFGHEGGVHGRLPTDGDPLLSREERKDLQGGGQASGLAVVPASGALLLVLLRVPSTCMLLLAKRGKTGN